MNLMRSMNFFPPLAAIFILCVGGNVSFVDASPAIGTVQRVSGMAVVVRNGDIVPATMNLEIWENDTLRTGPDGLIGLVFNDDTSLSLGPDSVLVVDEFIFAPKQSSFSIVLRMLKGTAVYLSGLISKLAPESAYFETPTASIGIRGTRFVVRVEEK